MKREAVIDLTKADARSFFLESETYCNFDLPPYFDFKRFLKEISKFSTDGNFKIIKAKDDATSHTIYNNKDGKYAWRKFQLIHPVIYLTLVDTIIGNWKLIQDHFRKNRVDKIHACPIYKRHTRHARQKKTQILSYLDEIEKQSIRQSLEFKYISKLDITDCYPSVYTHSVAWALHTKSIAKENRKNSFAESRNGDRRLPLVGNDVDFLLQAMQEGQTNGIPQGSVLMDFIAEIILTHIDKLLGDRLLCENITEYKIIRYRDDYRIFTKEKSVSEKIIKVLSEILMEFNFKLNTSKTEIGEDITLMSIKKDKLENIIYHIAPDKEMDIYKLKRLLLDILNISKSYPNSGFVLKVLQHFNHRGFYKKPKKWYAAEAEILITVLLSVAVNNPRCFAVVCISIFNLLSKLDTEQQEYFVDAIYTNLLSMNNIGYNEIWLQRSLYKVDGARKYEDSVCAVVSGTQRRSIFGNHFISSSDLKTVLNKNNFIARGKLTKMTRIPQESEVDIFANYQG